MHGINEYRIQLQQLIKWLAYKKKIHICVHYLTGAFQEDERLAVLPVNKVHYCSFCNVAKSTSKGLEYCMRSKRRSIKKALILQQPYTGRCYLGITEIVSPLFIGNEPFCIIYISNLVATQSETEIAERIRRVSLLSGVMEGSLCAELETLEKVDAAGLEEYKEIADIIAAFIKGFITESKTQHKPAHRNKADTTHWVVKQTLDYIDQYYFTDIKLSHIAGLYFINEQYLCRLFTQNMGESFTSYVNKVRVDKAKELLSSSDQKIIEIAGSVGFNNVTYFNSVFKKLTLATPMTYRKMLMEKYP